MNSGNEGSLLVVDDDGVILELVRDFLTSEGYSITAISNPVGIIGMMRETFFHVVITDINMPSINGLELLKLIKNQDQNIPVIMMTGSQDSENIIAAIKYGAYDYIRKPFKLHELLFSVQKAVHKRRMQVELDQYHQMLEMMVRKRTQQLADVNDKLEHNLIGSILAMVNALEASDKYTRGHSERVTMISLTLGKEMKLSLKELKMIRLGSVMHDIGKIGISHDILNKPAKLESYEFEVIKQHPAIGLDILKPIDMDEEISQIVNQHHERMDGTGYPEKLTGERISPLARIVSVADTFDAITSSRPYREAKSRKFALTEIESHSGSQLDKLVVDALKRVEKEITEEKLNNIDLIKSL